MASAPCPPVFPVLGSDFPSPLPAICTKTVIDVGSNNGADARFFLQSGYCVVSVDANPTMARKTRQAQLATGNGEKTFALNVGLTSGERGNATFYVNKRRPETSSFDASKASLLGAITRMSVPTVRCEDLWSLLCGHRPMYLKVDIEELHHVCIRALARVPTSQLPSFVSWEMHDVAEGRYPVLDVELILLLYHLGYGKMKVVTNWFSGSGTSSGGRLPDQMVDFATNRTGWVGVDNVLIRGIGNPRAFRPATHWDFHMRLGPLPNKTLAHWPERLRRPAVGRMEQGEVR